MPVFTVTATYKPNGNTRSRPVVSLTAEMARDEALAGWNVAENDQDFDVIVKQNADPDGQSERLLLDAERRRLENEFYARR